MDNYRGKSKVNLGSHNDQGNKIDLELKLGQSAFEEQINLGGVHAFSSMDGQSTHHMDTYSMFGGQGLNPNIGFNHSSLIFWPNENFLLYQDGPAYHNRKRPNADDGKVCRSCGSGNTPLWRKGPDGPQTLCNACGLRHIRTAKKGGE